MANKGTGALRLDTVDQALALGKNLVRDGPEGLRYSIYKFSDDGAELRGLYPRRVNAVGARIRFRRRSPPTGGADDARLGVGGMGDDIWRELLEKDSWSELDDAWRLFRRELELGRDIEVCDERGDPIESLSDFAEDDEPEYD